jgi:two-component system nitrate/nitrite response regulator NarL
MESEFRPSFGPHDESLDRSGESQKRSRAQISDVSVVLADDHPLFLQGLCALLRDMSGFEIIATHADGISALQSVRQFKPRIAVLGMSLAGFGGIDLLKHIQEEGLGTRAALLAATPKDMAAAITHGPWGIIPKQTSTDSVRKCLTAIAVGERWMPPGLVDQPPRHEAKSQNESEKIKSLLTKSELEISLLVAEGLSDANIARRLGICEATVKTELYNAYRKLGGMNRPSLMTLADRHHRSKPAKTLQVAARSSLARR